MKIYTKKGDRGETSLAGGERISKCTPLLNAYGSIDELNSSLGVLIAECPMPELTRIQDQLFTIAGLLATECDLWERYWKDTDISAFIQEIENNIDSFSRDLPPLKSFILPQGSREIALTHMSRTICRRAEREIAGLCLQKEIYYPLLQYVNRLSDFLFILARHLHQKNDIPEIYWKSNQ